MNKAPGGRLYRHLRPGHQRYRQGKRVQAEAIKKVVSIDERAAMVDSREPFGDWEIETVLGRHGTGAMVNLRSEKAVSAG